jgi:hypothetical protein
MNSQISRRRFLKTVPKFKKPIRRYLMRCLLPVSAIVLPLCAAISAACGAELSGDQIATDKGILVIRAFKPKQDGLPLSLPQRRPASTTR